MPPPSNRPVGAIAPQQDTSSAASGDQADIESGGSWTNVLTRSQQRKLRKGVHGSCIEPNASKPDTIILCASHFFKTNSESDFRDRLIRHDIKPLFCHKYEKEGSNYAYFKFCVKTNDVSKCLSEKVWPRGVIIREWASVRPL